MKLSSVHSDLPHLEEIKIMSAGQDKYEVHFDFLTVPVQMNRKYLETIVKDLTIAKTSNK